jgi:AcrR family transcriptional regulator
MTETPSLRDTLINAGLALLEEGGTQGLTLRRAAARAGVSHAAPAHHFDGMPGLMTAMAARAFQIFSDALFQGREAAGSDAFQRLLGTTLGYLAFARDHQGLFDLMFASPHVNRADPALIPHSARSYMILREACLPFAPPGASADPVLETAVWSMVHGYAALGFALDHARGTPFAPPPQFATLLQELLNSRQNPLAPRPDTR